MIALIKYKGDDPQKHTPLYFPRWTSMGTATKTDLAKIMQRGSTFSVGEVEGIMTDFAQKICDALLDGKTVDIQGLGKFTLKAKGKAQTNSHNVTTEDISLDVRFTPDPDLRLRLDTESEFQFVSKPSRAKEPEAGEP